MWKLATSAIGGLWNKIPGVAKWGVGLAGAGMAGNAVIQNGGLVGAGESVAGGLAQVSSEATVETTKNNFSKMLEWFADILEALGISNGFTSALRRVADRSLGADVAEAREAERTGNLPLNSPERAAQRIYEHGAQGDPDARYRIDGPNGSPPSVELSDQPPSALNTFSLGVKGVKDGVGVAVGWAGGLVAGVADFAGLDGHFGLGDNSDWAGKASRGLAGAVNETTDVLAYDVIGKGLGGAWGLATGQGLSGFTQDYEPTIRGDVDQSVYGVTSTVSGAVVGAFAGSWLTGAFSLTSAGAATLGEAAAAPMTTATLGAGVIRGAAGRAMSAATSAVPVPGVGGGHRNNRHVGPNGPQL